MTGNSESIFQRRPDLLPSIATVISSGLWGLYWIPARIIGDSGVTPAWTGPIIFASLIIVFSPLAVWRCREYIRANSELWITCCLAGLAFTLYTASFNLTDIVRALLLFYMTPIWSTILGITILGEKLTVNRVLAILLGFSGLAIVLGGGNGIPWPSRVGDWFGLAGGFVWALASVRFFKGGASNLFEKTYAFGVFAFIWAVIIILLPFDLDTTFPNLTEVMRLWPLLFVVTMLLLPALYCVAWPATVLSPARLGILFMTEAIVGIISASILTDEPFGAREIIGALMIMGAAIVELLIPQSNIERR